MAEIKRAGRSWRKFIGSRMGVVGLIMLILVTLMALFAPLLAPYDPYEPVQATIDDIYAPPSREHPLGTDDVGKDVLSSFIYGARLSLIVGFFAATISILIGSAIGVGAGFSGGRLENILMRVTDIILVIPVLPLIILLVALSESNQRNIILVIGLLGWTSAARVVRSQTLWVKQRKYVLRARASGAGNGHIIRQHILPTVLPIIVVNGVLILSLAILYESALGFLGLSDPTKISWGQMLNFAFTRGAMSAGAWWVLVTPGLGIIWFVLACALLGQGLEQLFTPRLETHHLKESAFSKQSGAYRKTLQEAPIILDVSGLSTDYLLEEGSPAHAVEDVSFTLREGEVLGLVGESGCGKTTLMMSLMRLLPANGRIVDGSVKLNGAELLTLSEKEIARVRWGEMAIIFQGAMNALNPVRKVGDQIAEAITHCEDLAPKKSVDDRVSELLDFVGIGPERRNQYPHQYSGGMRQRAMIAMALACSPQIVIADEPTTALDVMVQAQILELLEKLRDVLGLAIIFVTHDLGVVAETCDSVLVMYAGVTAEYADVDTIYNNPQHPYTKELLRAFPDINQPTEKLTGIPGYPPALNGLPSGCRFAPRCPVAMELCHERAPELHRLADGHLASCHLFDPDTVHASPPAEGA